MSKSKRVFGTLAPTTFQKFKSMRSEMGLAKLAEFSGVSKTTLHRFKWAEVSTDLQLAKSSLERVTLSVQKYEEGKGVTAPIPKANKKAKNTQEVMQNDSKELAVTLLRQLVDYPKGVVKEVLQMVGEIYG